MSSESEIQAIIQLAIGSLPGVRVFRTTVGIAWQGVVLEQSRDTVLLGNPRFNRFGLCLGSADLIGWRSLLIEPEHLGIRLAHMLSVEVKTRRGKPRVRNRKTGSLECGKPGEWRVSAGPPTKPARC